MEKLNEKILERGPEKRKISLWKSESEMTFTVFHEIIESAWMRIGKTDVVISAEHLAMGEAYYRLAVGELVGYSYKVAA